MNLISDSSMIVVIYSSLLLQSTGSLLHERRSVTLGSLIGITSVLELSNRRQFSSVEVQKKRCKPRVVCFSLCPRAADANVGGDVVMSGNAPSLGHYLEVERRACIAHRSWASIAYGRRIFLKDNDG